MVGAQGVVGFREQVVSHGPDQNGVHVNGGDPADIAWGIKEILYPTLIEPRNGEKTAEKEYYNILRGEKRRNKHCRFTRNFNLRTYRKNSKWPT